MHIDSGLRALHLDKVLPLKHEEEGRLEQIAAEIKEKEMSTKEARRIYVTFSTVREKEACIEAHTETSWWSSAGGGGDDKAIDTDNEKTLFFFGKKPKVVDALHPSDIEFESLAATAGGKSRIRCGSYAIVAVMTLLLLATVTWTESFKKDLASVQSNCPEDEISEAIARRHNATDQQINCYCNSLNYEEVIQKR